MQRSPLNHAVRVATAHAVRVHTTYHVAKPYFVDPDWMVCEQKTCSEMQAIVESIDKETEQREMAT